MKSIAPDVGKATRSRVFAHAKGELGSAADTLTDKLQRIRDIRVDGFEVARVIHRHGMDPQNAVETLKQGGRIFRIRFNWVREENLPQLGHSPIDGMANFDNFYLPSPPSMRNNSAAFIGTPVFYRDPSRRTGTRFDEFEPGRTAPRSANRLISRRMLNEHFRSQ